MSYDLFFKPRRGKFDPERFSDYFGSRRHYTVELSQAWYNNEDTGVYFVFELQSQSGLDEPAADEDDAFPVTLNINFFRPTYFVLEAEPEVTAFVRNFDLVVFDPQENGMGRGDYDAEQFLNGWNYGNEFGYQTFLRDSDHHKDQHSLPTNELLRVWSWNLNREKLQGEFGEGKFVPRIAFLLVSGQPVTAMVWPDGIPIVTTKADYLLVMRKDLMPERTSLEAHDMTLLSWDDALPMLTKHMERRPDELIVLDYDSPPDDVAEFIISLPKDMGTFGGLVEADRVLDRELVEHYRG